MQYPDSVLGHQDPAMRSLSGQLAGNLRQEKNTGSRWRDVYRRDCLRLQMFAKTLKTRVAGRRGGSALRLVGGDWVSNLRLLLVFLKNRVRRRSNQAAELWLLMGFARGRGNKHDCQDST